MTSNVAPEPLPLMVVAAMLVYVFGAVIVATSQVSAGAPLLPKLESAIVIVSSNAYARPPATTVIAVAAPVPSIVTSTVNALLPLPELVVGILLYWNPPKPTTSKVTLGAPELPIEASDISKVSVL